MISSTQNQEKAIHPPLIELRMEDAFDGPYRNIPIMSMMPSTLSREKVQSLGIKDTNSVWQAISLPLSFGSS